MTAQLDVEALVGRLEKAVEAYAWWDQLDGTRWSDVASEYVAAKDAVAAHIAGEDARVAAAVAGAVETERDRCAQLAEGRDDDDLDADEDMKIDHRLESWHRESSYGIGRADAAAAIRETPSA